MFADLEFIYTPGSITPDVELMDQFIDAVIERFLTLMRRLAPPKEKAC